MKVIVSAGGKFHAFALAGQLSKRGCLQRLITSYPAGSAVREGIPKEKVRSLLSKEIIERAWMALPAWVKRLYNPQSFVSDLFDKSAARLLVDADIFVGFSSFSLHSLRRAKQQGALTILERGSAHILQQRELLEDEYKRHAQRVSFAQPAIVEKELAEYQEADYVCVPSSFARQSFIRYGIPEHKMLCVPYGVDLSEFRQSPRKDNVFRVLYAGGLTLQKGIHYLLEAFSQLKLAHAELLLIGRMTHEIKPFFKKYEGTFRWIGYQPQSQLHEYYSQSSVFVLNSIQDGFGLVVLQAAACGVPVICTRNTVGADVIEDGKEGFVIPIRRVDILKEKLLFLYEHPQERIRMGQAALAKVRHGFSWDEYGEAITRAYQNILKKREDDDRS